MNTIKEIRKIEEDLIQAEQTGQKNIDIPLMKDHLNNLKDSIEIEQHEQTLQTQRDLAHYSAIYNRRIEIYKARTQRCLSGFDAMVNLGQGALKTAMLINGGACIALLAFISNIISKIPPIDISLSLSYSLTFFGLGVFLSTIAYGFAYVTQYFFENKSKKRIATKFQFSTMGIVLLSYISFIV